MTRIHISKLVLLVAVLSAFARAQVVLTDDANTSLFYPKTNFGGSIALIVCTGSNSYLKFNLANLGPRITSSNVSKATLVLYVDFLLTPGTMDVYQVSGSWSEGSVTYNTAPALGTKLFSGVSVNKTGFLSLDLTSTVQAWLAGTQTNDGIALIPSTGSAISASFDSKENTLTSHVADLTLALMSVGSVGPQGVQGPQGAVGPQGSTGATGPIGPPGIAGPQGSAGTNGANGTGFNFRSAFASSVTYAPNDVVTYNGSTYVATAANGPSNSNPDVDPAWVLMAQQGAAGGTGATGPQGPSGLTGAMGPPGAMGQTGAPGPQGVQGPAGPMGPIGGIGLTGPAGPATVVPNGIQIVPGTFGTFKVPAGVTRLLFETWGAGGSSSATQGGGAGGYCLAILNVNAGDVLNYRLGAPASSDGANGGDSTISDSGGTVLVDAGGGQAGTSSLGSGAGGLASPCPGLGIQGGYGGANGQAGTPPFASHFPFADPSIQPAVGNGRSAGYIVVSW